MIDFNKKHEELYLEEICNILNTSPRGGIGEISEETKICVLNIIDKLNLENTEVFLKMLHILKTHTTYDDFKSLCDIKLDDYGKENLNKIAMRVFSANVCDLILEKYGVKNEKQI